MSEPVQVYVGVCECGAVLASDSLADLEFPVRTLSCRECLAEIPTHLVTLPFRGLGEVARWRRLAVLALDRAELALHGEAESVDDLRARAITLDEKEQRNG